jgi:predicted HTH transcriptional regulator
MNINNIIQQPEGRRLEFKQEMPSVSDLKKTIVAFSNDAGGVIYIGVKDNPREIVGVPEEDLMQIEEQISNLIFDNCAPIIIPEISVVNVDGLYLIKVKVYRGNNFPYFIKQKGKRNGTYIRVGSNNRLATEEIIAELERQKRNVSFDSELFFENKLSELSIEKFEKLFQEKTEEELNVNALRKLNLLAKYNDDEKLTNALVLFSDGDIKNKYFPYAKIECARFKGTSTEVFIDQKTFDSNIAQQAEDAYEFVLRHINKGAKVEGIYTKTRWEYPVKAIREAIRNAVVHRDYSLSGKDIKIAIYDDMVEITSPGNLLPSIDFNQMEARQSDIRNKVIAPVFKKMGLIDQWGNGLKLITDELNTYTDIELKWFERAMQFQVQFVNENFESKNEEISKARPSSDQVATKSRLSSDQVKKLLQLCIIPKTRSEILDSVGYKNHTDNYKKYIEPLIQEHLIELTIPEYPRSSKQKYRTTLDGENLKNRND